MTIATLNEQDNTAPIDELVRRARSLYTLPAVASEVIQLTSNPKVDARALKECIQTDPALTAKLLRVVNSSLFGLSREVCDLNQALALLGTKPLKLLVLGFSLPESLFAEVAREQLDWYWSTTLTRAVAAREISEQLFDRPGDDAFLAGLFQDIGVLVLLGELKEPYADFLSGVIEQNVDLQNLEVESLGFDHLQLTAALLEHWNMPRILVDSIAAPRDVAQLTKIEESYGVLAKVLHLAELVAELVGQNRLGVLPDLMEIGAVYCELDKEQLNELVGALQPKVQQLAEVLSLDATVDGETDYSEIISAAHEQMSQLTEEVVELLGHPPLEEEQAYANLLADATRLRTTVENFLHQSSGPKRSSPSESQATSDSPSTEAQPESSQQAEPPTLSTSEGTADSDFDRKLTLAIGHCRSRRQPVSLIVLEMSGQSSGDAQKRQILGQVLEVAAKQIDVPDMVRDASRLLRHVLVLPGLDRHAVVRLAEETIGRIELITRRLEEKGTTLEYLISAGVSSVGLPPKNFPPRDLVESAERCLSAAQSSGSNVVKSLEIY